MAHEFYYHGPPNEKMIYLLGFKNWMVQALPVTQYRVGGQAMVENATIFCYIKITIDYTSRL
jgi:hypothetical protein